MGDEEWKRANPNLGEIINKTVVPGENCDVYAEVDFGRGPVLIRCTQKGPHQQCRCEVMFTKIPDKSPALVASEERTNIFERNANGDT